MQPANKDRFNHDERFAVLPDGVNQNDTPLHLGLSASEKNDVFEYLKSHPEH